MSSYVNLGATGTLDQSFHFRVTPEKSGAPCLFAEGHDAPDGGLPKIRRNCMLDIGHNKSTLGGSQQTAKEGCPDLKPYCCPGGFVGRPKKPLFEWGPIYARPKPWYPCYKDSTGREEDRSTPDSQIPGVYYIPSEIEWTNTCQIGEWRPPVF